MKTTTLLKPNSSNPKFYLENGLQASIPRCGARPSAVHRHASVAQVCTKMVHHSKYFSMVKHSCGFCNIMMGNKSDIFH